MKVKANKKHLEIEQFLSSQSSRATKVSLELPKNIDIEKKMVLDDYHGQHLSHSFSFHKSDNSNLALLYIKHLKKKDIQHERFNVAINLFGHQLNRNIKDVLIDVLSMDEEIRLASGLKAVSKIEEVLKNFRDLSFEDEKRVEQYKNIDALISHEFEQMLLELHTRMDHSDASMELRKHLEELCLAELEYRRLAEIGVFTSAEDVEQDNKRLSKQINKVELRKRLVALPSTISKKPISEPLAPKRIAIGTSTFMIMLIFSFFVVKARNLGIDTTMTFVFILAGMYIFRDLFREELRGKILSSLSKEQPDEHYGLTALTKNEWLGTQRLWYYSETFKKNKHLGYSDYNRLVCREKITTSKFDYWNYKQIKTVKQLNLAPILEAIKDKRKVVYALENGVVKHAEVRKQYLIKLKIEEQKMNESRVRLTHHEYKILIDSEGIIKINKPLVT